MTVIKKERKRERTFFCTTTFKHGHCFCNVVLQWRERGSEDGERREKHSILWMIALSSDARFSKGEREGEKDQNENDKGIVNGRMKRVRKSERENRDLKGQGERTRK